MHDRSQVQLVGRDREQAILRRHLHAARDGQGSLVLIGGEAGIGKTALVDWLAGQARQAGCLVLRGDAYDHVQAPLYGPWRGALAAATAPNEPSQPTHPLQDGEDLASIASQAALFDRVREFLTNLAATQPLAIVLEDLHWSDPASLDLLRDLARDISALSLLLMATYRVDELTRNHPLFQILPALVREARAERIDLASLTAEEIHAFVANRYTLAPDDQRRLTAHLTDRARGNPFYLGEVLRSLETERLLQPADQGWTLGDLERAPLPPLVRQVIESRLAKLDDETLRLLENAAVIGQTVPFDVWRAASGADRAELVQASERAAAAHLVVITPGAASLSFTHALVRETFYERRPLTQRRIVHRHVAEFLVDRPNPSPSVIASHFAQADDPRAIDWLIHAGEHALSLYAARDAIAALSRAHELAGRFAMDLPLTAYRGRAAAFALFGEFDRARRDHEFVLERARTAANRAAEWQALIDLGILWAARDYDRTERYSRAALSLARDIDDPVMIAHSLNRVGNLRFNLDEPDAALPLHREALAIFEERGDTRGIAETLDLLGMASYLRGDLPASTAYCEQAIPHLRALDDRQRLSGCLATLACSGGDLNCIGAAVYRETAFWIRSGEEALAIARDIGWTAGEAFALFTLSIVTAARGHLGRALRHAEAALVSAEQIGHQEWIVAARYALGATWAELLDLDRAETELELALAGARVCASRFWVNASATVLASVQIARGEFDRAAAVLAEIGLEKTGGSMSQRLGLVARAELALARGEPARAQAVVDELAAVAPSAPPAHELPLFAKLRGDVCAGLQRLEDADRTYQEARDSATLFGFLPILWRIDAALGQVYHSQGRARDAAIAYQASRATIAALAREIPDEALRGQFCARASARLPIALSAEQTPESSVRLSPRELDVLRLIVEGEADREIAAALSISPRTVMRHVTSILDKLGVSSRTAAATLAIRRNLV